MVAVVRMYQEVATSDSSIEFNVAWSDHYVPGRSVASAEFGMMNLSCRPQASCQNAIKLVPKIPIIHVVGYVVGLKDKSSCR